MPLLPVLVSIFAFNKRKQNRDGQNVDDNVKNASEDDKAPHRGIDIPESDTLESTNPSSLEKPVPFRTDTRGRPLRRRLSISVASAAVVKKPYTLSRRILRACHKFIFESSNEDMEGYSPKYRYLPIVSGLIVPLSILLEVPGLTEHWYQRQQGLQIIEYQPNPEILNIGLGFSIGCALLANICLIMRFLEKRIGSATVAAICLLLVHDIINITALVSFGVIHAVNDGFTYSEAYYVTLASTVVSLSVTVTLLIDYFRTPDFIKSGSGLTRKQRSLVIIVMILLSYLGFGALIYCFMMGIHFLDALYFCVCSSLTIGFGDISPSNTGAKIFSIFYNTFGILNAGLAIAIARETIVEAFQQSYRNRKHALALRRKMHRHAHAKHHAARHGLWLTSHRINGHLPDGIDLPIASTPPTPPPEPANDGDNANSGRPEQKPRDGSPTASMREKEAGAEELIDDPYHAEKLEEIIGDENDPTPEATPKEPAKKSTLQRHDTMLSARSARSGRSARSRSSTMSPGTPSRIPEKDSHVKSPEESQDVGDIVTAEREEAQEQVQKVDDHMVAGFGEEEAEYIKFRQEMIREEQKEFKAKLWVSWGLFVVFWVFGGVIFMLSEQWSYGIAIYFCFTAFSTIGYGDYAPVTGPGRVCFIAWSLLGVGTMTILVSVLSEAYQSRYSTMMHNGLFDKAIRSYQNKTHTKKLASHPDTPTYDTETMTVAERRLALDETRVQMAEIPPKIIAQAKVFHAHLHYVLTHNTQERPPPGLQRVLDELMDEEAMNEDLRKEVLQDPEARRTLFMMSFERTLKRMVENAERVSKLIEERDSLEEGLGWGLDRDDDEILGGDEDGDEDEDEGDDTYPDSPEDMREGAFDILSSEARDPSRKKSTAMSQWLKLRTGILLTPKFRHSLANPNNGPYLHASGSQSEPHLATAGEEEEGGNEPNGGSGPKGDNGGSSGAGLMMHGKRRHRPSRQPSKLSAVRFADNPYGDHSNPAGEEEDVVDNVRTPEI